MAAIVNEHGCICCLHLLLKVLIPFFKNSRLNYGFFKIKYSVILNTPLTSLPLKRTFDTTFKYLAYSVDEKRENLKINQN